MTRPDHQSLTGGQGEDPPPVSLDLLSAQLKNHHASTDSCFSGWHFHNVKDDSRRPFRCGGWRCRICGPPKQRKYGKIFAAMASEYNLNFMWSLTLPGKGSSLRGKSLRSRQAIGPMWNRIRNGLEYSVGKMTFICVPEPQRDGTAHLHFITNKYIPKAAMDAAWGAAGGGYSWVERGDVHRTGKYIAKYLAKGWEGPAPWDVKVDRYDPNGQLLKNQAWKPWRRYWLSRNLKIFKQARRNPDVILIQASAREWSEICEFLESLWKTPPPSDDCIAG